jgi:Fe-S-cluster-containing dehydrogenase component
MRFHIEVEHAGRCIGCYSCVYACSRHLYSTLDPARVAVFVRVNKSLENPFDVIACRFCAKPECALACPYDALEALPEGGVTLTPSRCAECKTFDCIDACKIAALVLDMRTKVPIICDRCGDCAKYCPHDVFKYEELKT